MPFNFRLGKRSQQYNVASKDLFVIPIELLTNDSIECTLLASSTGQECLNNVCQKIGVQQPEYFSLLFRSKKNVDQWVDLNKPLKKQLTKYSAENRLYFRLQYFVPNFHFLSDELSRYHYFCAMKNLVIDGRIACSRDDAILLASFSLQAEFGDYSPEKHTVEYLNNFSLFPKSMVTNKIARDVLIECAINAYRSLQGVPPSVAEIYYISEAQRREGYGQEGFPARDLSTGQEVCLGVCIRGIFVVNTDNNTLELFKWMDIANLMHNKKVFTIERHSEKYSKNYSTYDSDYASCIWQTCVEQHQYFMKGIQTATENESIGGELQQQQQTTNVNHPHTISSIPFIHNTELFNQENSVLQKMASDLNIASAAVVATNTAPNTDTTDFNNRIQTVYETIGKDVSTMPSSTTVVATAAAPVTTTTTTTVLNQSLTISNTELPSVGNQQPDYSLNNGCSTNLNNILRKRSSTEPVDLHHITINCANNYNLKSGELTKEMATNANNLSKTNPSNSDVKSNSSSTNNIPIYENQSNLNDLTYEQKKKLLPPYKSPPDYETFLKNKYLANSLSQSLTSIPSRLASHNQMNSSSSSSSLIHPNICTVSSSTMSVPQLFQQPQQQHQNSIKPISSNFAASVYPNYTDLSNLIAEKTSNGTIVNKSNNNGMSGMNHRCSLPPNDSFSVIALESLGLNQLNNQHQRLQKSGMVTASSPDLNSLNLIYKRNHIKTNGIIKINEITNGIEAKNQKMKKPHYFTSVPDLSFKSNQQSSINELGNEKKLKTKNFFPFGGKNLKFFWQQNKTGSEPNLFNNFSYSPNCYNLKRSKFSIERLDFGLRNNSNYGCSDIPSRPSISYKIDELPETSAEQSNNKSETNLTKNETETTGVNISVPDVKPVAKPQVTIVEVNSVPQQKQTQPQQQSTSQIENDKSSSKNQSNDTLKRNQMKSSRIIVFDKSFDDQDFTKEFELLPRMNPTAKFTTASLPDNILRNRFRDILPYEENRVKLTPTKENKHGYINASHVIMTIGSMKQHYIAAQGPLPNTTLDFWQMVFEQRINLIVMVTNFTEAGSQKCYTYLPLSSEPGHNTLRFGDYEITCNYTSTALTYISSSLTLSHNGQKHCITHLRYTDWNDHSIPDDLQSFLTFLSEMDAIYRQNNREGSGFGKKRSPKILPPILVHCSAGAGRSGVVILCDALLKCLDYNFEPIDIPKALIQLRYQRMISVQHCEQFRFVCQVLSQYLSNSRLI